MDRNWDRSNDKYVSILIQQQEAEAAGSVQLGILDRRQNIFISIIRALSHKIGKAGG